MRRFLAVLLCVALFAGMVPAEALADTLLYEYPSVNAYLAPNNLEALEYEFRQWAAQTLENYLSEGRTAIKKSENLNLTGVQDAYSLIEYYRMAKTKKNFDSDKGKIKENIYNNYEMNESERQGMYLWVFIESVKEKMYANQNLLEQYNKIDEDEKRYWMLDVETGGLKKDNFAQQAQNASNDVAIAKWSKVATKAVTALAETVADYFIVTKGSKDTADELTALVDGLGKMLDSVAETVIDANETNALNKIDNAVREELQADLSEAVNNVSDEMLEYLKESYVNTENRMIDRGGFGADYYTKLIKDFVDSVESNRSKYQQDLKTEVSNSMAEETAAQIISDINYEMLDLLDAKEITTMAIINGFKTAFEELLVEYFNEIKEDESIKGCYMTISQMDYGVSVGWTDVIDSLKKAVVDQEKEGFEECIREIQNGFRSGEITDVMLSDSMANAIFNVCEKIWSSETWEKFKTNMRDGIKKNITSSVNDIALSAFSGLEDAVLEYFETVLQIGENALKKGGKIGGNDVKTLMKGLFKLAKNASAGGVNVNQTLQSEIKKSVTDEGNKKISEKGKGLEQLKEKEQPLTKNAMSIVLKVADKWWDVGCSIRSALESSASASSGEGIMSMLAMRMVTCENMSMGLKNNINLFLINNENNFVRLYALGDAGFKEAIMNPQKTSLEELYSLVSQLYVANQYDIVGSSAYLDMVLHEDVFYKDWNWSSAKFAKYIEDNHINNQGKKGLLPFYEAAAEYNGYVIKNTAYEIDDKWRALFN